MFSSSFHRTFLCVFTSCSSAFLAFFHFFVFFCQQGLFLLWRPSPNFWGCLVRSWSGTERWQQRTPCGHKPGDRRRWPLARWRKKTKQANPKKNVSPTLTPIIFGALFFSFFFIPFIYRTSSQWVLIDWGVFRSSLLALLYHPTCVIPYRFQVISVRTAVIPGFVFAPFGWFKALLSHPPSHSYTYCFILFVSAQLLHLFLSSPKNTSRS